MLVCEELDFEVAGAGRELHDEDGASGDLALYLPEGRRHVRLAQRLCGQEI